MSDLQSSYWWATATPAPKYAPLRGHEVADVCVVGGGFLGLSTALHVAKAGTSVVVLDAEEPGWGASGRNGGQIIPGWKVEHSNLLQQFGREAADRITDWASGFIDLVLDIVREHSIDCGASKSGWVQAAHSYDVLRMQERRAERLRTRGADVDVVDGAAAAKLLGTTWYKGAFIDRRGGRLHPFSYARGLAAAAAAAGARIHGASLVTHLARQADGWKIMTAAGQVLSKNVVMCTNAYTDSMGNRELVPGLAKTVVPLQSYMVATAPLPASLRETILPGGEVVADYKKLMHHFRLEEDGCFLFGGRGGLREREPDASYQPLLSKLPEIYPQLRDAPIKYRWSGKVAITSDGGPHLHRPAPGLLVALGCNGRGVGMCTAAGKLMAELINGMSDEQSPMPISTIKAIPFHSLRLVGVQAAVWFKSWQDKHDYAKTA